MLSIILSWNDFVCEEWKWPLKSSRVVLLSSDRYKDPVITRRRQTLFTYGRLFTRVKVYDSCQWDAGLESRANATNAFRSLGLQ